MLVLAGLAAWSIWVDAPAPTAWCALADDVAASLAPLLPEASVHGGAAPAPHDLRLTIDPGATGLDGPGGGAVVVLLFDETGARLLARTLPAASSCPELAESVALLLERYFSDLSWQVGTVAIDRPPPGDDERADAADASAPPPARPRAVIEATARAGLALGATQATGAVGVELGGRALRVTVELGGAWPRTEPVRNQADAMIGELDTSTLHALVGGAYHRGGALAAVWLGGERLAASAAGTAVFQRVDQAGWQALARVDLGYDLRVTQRLAVRVSAGVELRPSPVEVRVEGSDQVHASPTVRALLGAGVTWRLR